jgi:membrane protein YqaA with SNARE-associated domain
MAIRYRAGVNSAPEDQRKLSRRNRIEQRIERFLESLEGPDSAAAAEVIVASENQRFAIIGIVTALIGMTVALVVAYTVGGPKLVARFGYIGVFMFAVIGSASMFIPVPGAAAGITLGLLLEPIPHMPLPQPIVVGIVVAAGSAIGELTGYSTGVGGRAVIGNSRLGKALVGLMRRHGTLTVFCVAAVPNPFIDVGGIAAGVAGMKMQRFIVVMFVGKCVNYITVAYVVSSGFQALQRVVG